MSPDLISYIWSRAGHRCEYCHLPSAGYPLPLQMDHIIARQHGGETDANNLALACVHCNRHKGPNIGGIDPATGSLTACSTLAEMFGRIISSGVASNCGAGRRSAESQSRCSPSTIRIFERSVAN